MSNRLHLDGEWPSPVILRKGWAKAVARPWNDDLSDIALRLERGGHSFLNHVSAHLAELVDGSVFSPALYEFATRIWRRAGYADQIHLDIMERSLGTVTDPGPHPTWVEDSPDMHALASIDRRAFEGFWQLGESGLSEAVKATAAAVVIMAGDDSEPFGYAIVGSQMDTAFLQRIAVVPDHEGSGYGSSLLNAATAWARKRGARTMILNVRPDSTRARDFYLRAGFDMTGSKLHVLRFED